MREVPQQGNRHVRWGDRKSSRYRIGGSEIEKIVKDLGKSDGAIRATIGTKSVPDSGDREGGQPDTEREEK